LGDRSAVEFPAFEGNSKNLPVRGAFPEADITSTSLVAIFKMDTEARMIVDAGPVGYKPIAAHGHAEA